MGGGTTRPLGRALKSGLWPSPSWQPQPPTTGLASEHGEQGLCFSPPTMSGAHLPSCQAWDVSTWTGWGALFPPATLLPVCLASLPGDQWRKHFLRKAGIFRWTMPDWPVPYLPHLISSPSPLQPYHTLTLCLQAKSPPPQPTSLPFASTSTISTVPSIYPGTKQTLNE